jgi:hypothetical protein
MSVPENVELADMLAAAAKVVRASPVPLGMFTVDAAGVVCRHANVDVAVVCGGRATFATPTADKFTGSWTNSVGVASADTLVLFAPPKV